MSLYTDASLIMYPSGYKEDKIYSLKPTDGSGDLTFTRASTATRVNSEGLIETASVLGSELITNGDFATDTIWVKGTGTTISGGKANLSNGNAVALYQDIGTQSGLVEVTFTVTNYTSGTLNVYSGSNQSATDINVVANALGTYTFNVIRTGGNANIIFGSLSNFTGSIDNVSIKEVITLNVPRIDYTSGCGSLLLEPQRTNLATYSEQFDNAAWTKSNTTISANATTSPDGTINADKLVEDTSTGIHILQPTTPIVTVVSTSYSLSAFYKIGERPYAIIGLHYNTSNGCVAEYEFSTDTFVYSGAAGTNYSISNLKSIILANGFVKLSCTVTTGHTVAFPSFGIHKDLLTSGIIGNNTYTGDGTSGVYVWGGQLEAGSYVSSYIPTLASSVTRLADSASKSGISSLIGQTQGTLFCDFNVLPSTLAGSYYVETFLTDGTLNNKVALTYYADGRIQFVAFASGSLVVNIDLPSYGLTVGKHKFAFAYKLNDYVAYADGALVGTDTSATVPSMSALNLYDTIGGTHAINQAIVFPTRLSNAELATLTTL